MATRWSGDQVDDREESDIAIVDLAIFKKELLERIEVLCETAGKSIRLFLYFLPDGKNRTERRRLLEFHPFQRLIGRGLADLHPGGREVVSDLLVDLASDTDGVILRELPDPTRQIRMPPTD